MHNHDYEFMRAVLVAVEENAPLGFDNATMTYDGFKLEWTTIIVNDMPMMEVKLWNEIGDFLYWRVTDLENAVVVFGRWWNDTEGVCND